MHHRPRIRYRVGKYGWSILLAFSCLASPPTVNARQWVDATGKYKLNADLVDMKDGYLLLKKTGGEKVSVRVDRLSSQDKAFVDKLRGANELLDFLKNEIAGSKKEIFVTARVKNKVRTFKATLSSVKTTRETIDSALQCEHCEPIFETGEIDRLVSVKLEDVETLSTCSMIFRVEGAWFFAEVPPPLYAKWGIRQNGQQVNRFPQMFVTQLGGHLFWLSVLNKGGTPSMIGFVAKWESEDKFDALCVGTWCELISGQMVAPRKNTPKTIFVAATAHGSYNAASGKLVFEWKPTGEYQERKQEKWPNGREDKYLIDPSFATHRTQQGRQIIYKAVGERFEYYPHIPDKALLAIRATGEAAISSVATAYTKFGVRQVVSPILSPVLADMPPKERDEKIDQFVQEFIDLMFENENDHKRIQDLIAQALANTLAEEAPSAMDKVKGKLREAMDRYSQLVETNGKPIEVAPVKNRE